MTHRTLPTLLTAVAFASWGCDTGRFEVLGPIAPEMPEQPAVLGPVGASSATSSGPTTDPVDPVVVRFGPPHSYANVVVIGSGPAGLAAATTAQEAGASVIVLERAPFPGGSGWYAGSYFAVDTRFQTLWGIEDSVEHAAEEWSSFTGGDATRPHVRQFLERSHEVIDWLVEDVRADVRTVVWDPTLGPTPRLHLIDGLYTSPVAVLSLRLREETWLQTEASQIVTDARGDVVGVRYRKLDSGDEGWIRAGAVVVATGGFARDLDRVRWDRPELEGVSLIPDAAPTTLGLGHDLLLDVGADWQNRGAGGVYVHGLPDPRPKAAGELLLVNSPDRALIVDETGARVTNEEMARGLALSEVLVAAPGKRLFALYEEGWFMSGWRPLETKPWTWTSWNYKEVVWPWEVRDAGLVTTHDDIADAAAAWGIDPDGLVATVDRYEELVAQHYDADFGKSPYLLHSLGYGGVAIMQMQASPSKSFSGVRIDPDGRVLDVAGEPIPGLFAAGEVTGMLGDEGVGFGFNGSVTGVYLTGLIAGETAVHELR